MEIPFEFIHNKINLLANSDLQTILIPSFQIFQAFQIQNINEYSVANLLRCFACNSPISIFRGSVFYNNKIKLNEFHFILISYLDNETIAMVGKRLNDSQIFINRKTLGKYFHKFRSLIVNFIENLLTNMAFEGICEVDEVMSTSKRLGAHGCLPLFF